MCTKKWGNYSTTSNFRGKLANSGIRDNKNCPEDKISESLWFFFFFFLNSCFLHCDDNDNNYRCIRSNILFLKGLTACAVDAVSKRRQWSGKSAWTRHNRERPCAFFFPFFKNTTMSLSVDKNKLFANCWQAACIKVVFSSVLQC